MRQRPSTRAQRIEVDGRGLHERLLAELSAAIESGAYPPGTLLPTARELAEQWGVSYVTAHRVVVGAAKANLVMRRPGVGSFVRRKRATTTIGIICPQHILVRHSAPYWPMVIHEAQQFFHSHSSRVRIFVEEQPLNRRPAVFNHDLVKAIESQQIQGALFLSGTAQWGRGKLVRLLEQHQIPHVRISAFPSSVTRYSVVKNDAQAAELAVDYLVEHGHDRMAIVVWDDPALRPDDALSVFFKGYCDALARHNITRAGQIEILSALQSEVVGVQAAEQLLAMPNLPPAVIVNDDIIARGLCSTLVAHDIERARRLTIITPYTKGSGLTFPLPVVKIEFDSATIMDAAATILLDLIEGRKVAEPQILIPHNQPITELQPQSVQE